jgi:hypothetical protein
MLSRELKETIADDIVLSEVLQMRVSLILTTLAVTTAAFGQVFPNNTADSFYQIGFAANLNIGDSVVNITNDGFNGGVFNPAAPTAGNICVNTYVFDPQEEEIGCCACLVTPNGLNSLSVKSDLISNNLTPAVPTSVVIKLLGSLPSTTAAGNFTICNPATAGTTMLTALEYGMVAWGSTLEPAATPGTYGPVNVPFGTGALSGMLPGVVGITNGYLQVNFGPGVTTTFGVDPVPGTELFGLTSLCNFIQANGTGFGICKSCRLGALGGAKQ